MRVVRGEQVTRGYGAVRAVEGVVDVGAVEAVRSAESHSMVFHASWRTTVLPSCSALRFASSNPIQSLYRFSVSRMVGFPVRQPATVENSSSYMGRCFLVTSAAHTAPILAQSLMLPVVGSTGDPQGASSARGQLLWAIPTMMASAAVQLGLQVR